MTDRQSFPLGDYNVPDYYSVIAKELEKDNIVVHAVPYIHNGTRAPTGNKAIIKTGKKLLPNISNSG